RALQAPAPNEPSFLRFAERPPLAIALGGGTLLFGRSFLSGGKRVSSDGILRIVEDREACGDQLLIPSRQGAIAEQRFKESRNAQRERRCVRERLEHVGNDAPLLQQGVIDSGDFRRNLVALQQRNSGRDRGHVRSHTAVRTGSGAAYRPCC